MKNFSTFDSIDTFFIQQYPPGHFYSPLPSLSEFSKVAPRVFGKRLDNLPGIDLNEDEQLRHFKEFIPYYHEMPFTDNKKQGHRYYFQNNMFSYADAFALYSILRHYKPRNVVEIGSGFSSCLMLDTNDIYFNGDIKFNFIDPYPERLSNNIFDNDRNNISIFQNNVQDFDSSFFLNLKRNDVLFIDSSHVGKIGSDLLYILFDILPILSEGVIIHFHDIFYPFEYPRSWYENLGRAWNENYFLRAFLQFNNSFKIIYFNSFISFKFRSMLQKHMPLCLKNTGGSIWMVKSNVVN
ncbi:class I SAM-dependent methyltransferase [Desulfonatronum thioautotrophicum]|uniref:class I SAM-dependent methyltransferase n=1 Tax=Desulfonatronum thioautotrophicum TaxID=617001 RepID=UPI00129469F4|nr:class I SAM-dependent methyltransferase [Desulfonatronum thioautotrophicum]